MGGMRVGYARSPKTPLIVSYPRCTVLYEPFPMIPSSSRVNRLSGLVSSGTESSAAADAGASAALVTDEVTAAVVSSAPRATDRVA